MKNQLPHKIYDYTWANLAFELRSFLSYEATVTINIHIYLSQYLTKLMHKICFTISFISCLYMFPAHVLIIRRSKLPIGVMIPEAV